MAKPRPLPPHWGKGDTDWGKTAEKLRDLEAYNAPPKPASGKDHK